MHLAAIYVYPVKGCRGLSVLRRSMDPLGFVGDRRFMIVDQHGKFLTQRTEPRLAQVDASLDSGRLRLSHAEIGAVEVPLEAEAAPLRSVQIWKSEGLQAEDCGSAAAGFLNALLRFDAQLVRIGSAFHRPVKPSKARPGDVVAFTDAYPFMAISEASLADLNRRLAEAGEAVVPMSRFRPNLVFAGCGAYEEDTWTRLTVGKQTFRSGGPCARCIVTTTDQTTGERGKEPLRTLAQYRRDATDPSDVNFGQNFIHETKFGEVQVGDAVVPL